MRTALAVDPAYLKLVSETPPKVIHTKKETAFYLAKLEELNGRWNTLSRAEKELYETLRLLIKDFESRTYKVKATTPVEALEALMKANGLKRKDMVGIFETASVVSDVLNGKRPFTTQHIARLSRRFRVSTDTFFPS